MNWIKYYNYDSNIKRNILNKCINTGIIPSIKKIFIETVNYCNCHCQFCPIGLGLNDNNNNIINDKVFNHIINILELSNYSGYIALHNHGEPLLDKDIFKRAELIKNVLPTSTVYFSTNGILVKNRLNEILNSKTDFIIINCYDTNTYNKIIKLDLDSKRYLIKKRYESEFIYTNRAGVLYNIEKNDTPCVLPFIQLSLDVYGNIKNCCYDATGVTIFDNVMNYDNLNSLWLSDKFKNIRSKIAVSRLNLNNCNNCDTNDCEVLRDTLNNVY